MAKNSILLRFFRKHGANNLPEFLNVMFKRLQTVKTPENEVKAQLSEKQLNPKQSEINQLLQTTRLANFLSYEYYDEEHGVYQTNRSYGFVLEATTLTGVHEKTDDILRGIYNIGLPDNSCIQFILQASSELDEVFDYWKSARNPEDLYQTIVDERIKFYKTGTKNRLFNKNKIIARNFRLLISFTFEGAFEEQNAQFIENIKNAVYSIFKSVGIESRTIYPTELINFAREVLCIRQDSIEKVEYDNRLAIKDQIADPDNNIYIDTDGLVVNDTAIRSLSIRKYPTEPRLSMMNSIIGDTMSSMLQISYPFMLVCNIQILNAERTNGVMSIEAERVAKQSKNGMGKWLPIIDKKAHEYQLIKHLLSEGEGFVNLAHYLHLFTPLGNSEEAFQEVQAVYRSKGWELVNNSNIQFPTLLSSMPLFHDPISAQDQISFRMLRQYTQTNSINTLPIISDWKGTGGPMLMLLGRRGQVQFLDIFDNTGGNFNVSVAATSGAGKSFLLNEMVVSYRSCGAKVRVIDVGKSYKNACELLGGQFIEFSESSKICVNPFSFIGDLEKDDLTTIDEDLLLKREDLKDQIEMLKAIIMVAAGRDLSDKTEDSFVEQAILNSLHREANKATFTTVYEELMNLEDKKGRTKDIAESIKSYTKYGIHGEYFEGESNLDFNNDLVVLELEELKSKGQLVFVVLLIVMLKITQEMYLGDRAQKKLCIIDEAWDLMGKGNSGQFIETGYRRARKYGGAFLTATQSIDDYFMNDTTKACWTNAAIRFLLKQGTESRNEKFDDYTDKLLNSVTTEKGVYSEALVSISGVTCGIVRLIVDDFSNFIYSSNANDVQLVNYIKQYEKLDTAKAVKRAIFMCNDFALRFKMDKHNVSATIVPQIKEFGYEKFITSFWG